MNVNTRFTVAIHTLTLLAAPREANEPVTSEYIAGSVNTNPVVIRRVLGQLRSAGLVTSQGGNGGGWRLSQDPEKITLCDVYQAVEDERIFALHHRPPNPHCPVGSHIQQTLTPHFEAATKALESELSHTTLADITREVFAQTGCQGALSPG